MRTVERSKKTTYSSSAKVVERDSLGLLLAKVNKQQLQSEILQSMGQLDDNLP
ncbi:hypothetical protein [Nioella sp.]|uniref:hypothetical protein n=1 Tax=Nioella sp. TaxID=1912091 RepID=UPI003B52B007